MSQEHPITPPPELVEQWCTAPTPPGTDCLTTHLATKAARWGADQELEACVEWLADDHTPVLGQRLRAARRLKPPSLKKEALQAVAAIKSMADDYKQFDQDIETIRRALESLPD